MFSGIRNFVSRHRRKFIFTGAVVAGSVLALRYAQRKLLEYQEAKAREFFEKTRRTQHFETTERTCNQAIMGLAPNLIDQILRTLDTEPILEKLRKNPENKIDLWNEVKILAFSRLTAFVYACSMLVVTLRIQFNILGGYLYKDTVSGEEKISNSLQQSYVALIQFFLKDGVEALCKLIESKVRQVLNGYELNQKLTLAETEQIFWSIQMAVNSDAQDPNSALAIYVFPPDALENSNSSLFSKMFNETVDMMESDDTSSLNTNNSSRGFSIVMDSITDFYMKPINGTKLNGITKTDAETPAETKVENEKPIENDAAQQPSTSSKSALNSTTPALPLPNLNPAAIPLAKLIPIIDGLAKQQFSNSSIPPGLSTSLVTLYLISDKIKMLGANVYEVFCQ